MKKLAFSCLLLGSCYLNAHPDTDNSDRDFIDKTRTHRSGYEREDEDAQIARDHYERVLERIEKEQQEKKEKKAKKCKK